MYKFKFKINEIDIFNSSMNYKKKWINLIFDCFVTFASLIIIIYSIVSGLIFKFSIFQVVMLIICFLLFPVIEPIIIYLKSISHAKKIKDIEINMEFTDEKVLLSTNNENTQVLYENVYNFIKYKNMIVIMYDPIHGQIMPNRIFDGKKEEFYDFVANKIKNAREIQKNK